MPTVRDRTYEVLRAHGITTRRYTGDQLEGVPREIAADLRAALSLPPVLVTKT